ncbi:receptor-like protein 36 isoform X2 [Salvia splendens]|uniref:receptor-like protein 36 isoform X2 n=1 Tax=Salvia splendens TaxID=180675 RepID=UPI001C254862|nr:receptor-like protein 36 isoform X2 [Salvia splendens]
MHTSSHLYLLITLLLFLQCMVDYSSANSDINTDRSSLIAFKSRISLDPQDILTKSWNNESSICSWIGVTCDSHHKRVTQLNLTSMDLVGKIPPEIGNLSFLVSLDLSGNSFYGPIPPSIFNMSFLEYLQLRYNSLSGSLPLDMCIHNLHRLKFLHISYNELYGEIPSSLEHCSQLEYFSLYNNSISGFVPKEIGNLMKLQLFIVGVNKLIGYIPKEIGNMTMIEWLGLSNNNLSGNIPKEISYLTKLRILPLSFNQFSGPLPNEIGNITSLTTLELDNNEFSGNIPEEVFLLNNLRWLDIGYNRLRGSLPKEIEFFKDRSSTTECYLFYITITCTGSIPSAAFVNQSSLLSLELSSNNINGEIPPSICNLRSLQVLLLSYNSLRGPIPDCLGNLSTSLVILHLNANKLTGPIPSTFTKGCTLQSINLNGNKLEGILPHTLVNCKDFLGIDIGDNEIRDVFPFWMETLPQLRVLVLRSNKFNGAMSLAASYSNTERSFPKLQVLDISHNAFVGILPDRYINNFRGMIDAKENQTDDEAKRYLFYLELKLTLKGVVQLLERLLDTFTTLDLSSNRFSGSIPPSIGNLNSLRYLNLSHNTLSGHIPPSLGSMSLLESLDLSSNILDGKIPRELAKLTFLAKLNVSINSLEGQIPQVGQLSTFDNESYAGNAGLRGFPMTKECERAEGKPSTPYVEAESDREIKWDYVFAAAGYVVSIGMFSWLLLFCRSFRYKYFEKVDDVFEKIFECCQCRKKRDRRRRVVGNQARRQ